MDYEKEYKDAVARMELCVRTGLKITPEYIFPELAESEDERIRKFLVDYFTSYKIGNVTTKLNGYRIDDILAYLEKQKEKFEDISTVLLVKKEIERRIETWQKSRKEALAMECNTLADDAAVRIEELNSLISFLGTIRYSTNEKQKEQKPEERFEEAREKYQVEWSEEDEDIRQSIIKDIKWERDNTPVTVDKDIRKYDKQINWLKSLRPSWKPSEEQIHAIIEALKYLPNNKDEWIILNTLADVLRKLM